MITSRGNLLGRRQARPPSVGVAAVGSGFHGHRDPGSAIVESIRRHRPGGRDTTPASSGRPRGCWPRHLRGGPATRTGGCSSHPTSGRGARSNTSEHCNGRSMAQDGPFAASPFRTKKQLRFERDRRGSRKRCPGILQLPNPLSEGMRPARKAFSRSHHIEASSIRGGTSIRQHNMAGSLRRCQASLTENAP